MECGKLTAKLRDMVTVRFFEEEEEVMRYRNIEVPDEIKKREYSKFEFCVPFDGHISFKIWLEEHIENWPEARERRTRKKTEEVKKEEMSVKYLGDRKNLVATLSTILSLPYQYLALPTYAYQIGEYRVEKDGTLVGPGNDELKEKLREMGFETEEA